MELFTREETLELGTDVIIQEWAWCIRVWAT